MSRNFSWPRAFHIPKEDCPPPNEWTLPGPRYFHAESPTHYEELRQTKYPHLPADPTEA